MMNMKNNLNDALMSMGYRKYNPNKSFWCKPFCFSLLSIYVEDNHVLMKLIYSYKGQPEVWFHSEFDIEDDTDILKALKLSECEVMEKYHEMGDYDSNFEFLTLLDKVNLF